MHVNTIKQLVKKANSSKRQFIIEDTNFTLIVRNVDNYGEILFKTSYKSDMDCTPNEWLKHLKKETPKVTFKDIPLKVDEGGKPHILNQTALLDSRMQRMQTFTFSEEDIVSSYREVLAKVFAVTGDYVLHTFKNKLGNTVTTVWTPVKELVTFYIRGIEDEDIVLNPLFVA
jgi:hypothetical protein